MVRSGDLVRLLRVLSCLVLRRAFFLRRVAVGIGFGIRVFFRTKGLDARECELVRRALAWLWVALSAFRARVALPLRA